MRRSCIALAFFFALACAHAPERATLPRVHSLQIDGAKQVDAEYIRAHLVTRTQFDPVAWDADVQRVARVYQTAGFYDAAVVGHREQRRDDGSYDLEVSVVEGEPVKLTGITITGLERLPDAEQKSLMAGFPLRQGAILHEWDWSGLPSALQLRLEDLGYAEAKVTGEMRVLPPAHEAKAFIDVAPGVKYRFGEIVVVTQPVPSIGTKPIIAEASLAARRGEPFRRKALEEVQLRVFQLGIFDAVQVAPGTPHRDQGVIDVFVDVRELKWRELRLGGGVAIEPAQQEVHAFGEYSDQSWLGALRKFRVQASAGYAFLPGLLSVATNHLADAPNSGPIGRLLLSVEQPELFAPGVRGFVSLEGARNIDRSYENFETRAELGVVWHPTVPLSFRFSFDEDAYRLESPVPLSAADRRVLFGCPDICYLGSLRQRAEWDTRDSPLDPKRGHLLGLDLREALPGLSSGGFLLLTPEARAYTSFAHDKFTLAGKVRYGVAVHGAGTSVPIVASYFSGGAEQMRGFSYHRLSPMLVVPREGVAAGEPEGVALPVGGDGLFDASLELRDRLTQNLTAAVFSDVGAVTSQRLDFGALGDALQWAVGLGARYRTPLGEVRMDLAYRPPAGSALEVSQLPGRALTYARGAGCFGIGKARSGAGAPEGACSFHLVIGEAF